MIEQMKKVSIVSLQEAHEETLKTLRDLEIIHVDYKREESPEFSDSLRQAEALDTAVRALKEFKSKEEVPAGQFAGMELDELAASTIQLVHDINEARETILELHREVNEWMPWGDFKPEAIEELKAKGLHVELCRCSNTKAVELPEGAFCIKVAEAEGDVFSIVASMTAFDTDGLPTVKLPDNSLSQLSTKIREQEEEIDKLKKRLARAATQSDRLEKALLKRAEAADFVRAGDSMGKEGQLEYISGYIPANRRSELVQMAYRRGWALLLEDPAPDDPNIPTLLRVPGWLKVSKPIFDFVGISPGYNEFDVSALFLIFFTIFFGMIIGDGGYGAVLMVAAIAAKVKIRDKGAQPTINLFLLLTFATVIWGFLTGNFFAIPTDKLPTPLRGLEWFTSAEHGQQNVQFLCFIIAVIHLSIAHGWKSLSMFASKKPISGVGEIGWMLFCWGAFLYIVKMVVGLDLAPEIVTGANACLGVGFVLMLCSVNWKDVGDILNFPFGALGGFVDTLSYIRLFAVGLSGYYVADAVNSMATDLMGAGSIGFVAGLVVLLFGHLLNVALCAMGVLVHGIRLNTLEFSGHLGLEWAGIAFAPFRRRLKNAK